MRGGALTAKVPQADNHVNFDVADEGCVCVCVCLGNEVLQTKAREDTSGVGGKHEWLV